LTPALHCKEDRAVASFAVVADIRATGISGGPQDLRAILTGNVRSGSPGSESSVPIDVVILSAIRAKGSIVRQGRANGRAHLGGTAVPQHLPCRLPGRAGTRGWATGGGAGAGAGAGAGGGTRGGGSSIVRPHFWLISILGRSLQALQGLNLLPEEFLKAPGFENMRRREDPATKELDSPFLQRQAVEPRRLFREVL